METDFSPTITPQSPIKRTAVSKNFSFADPAVLGPGGKPTSDALATAEVALYEAEPCISATQDPLLWWRANAARFPNLAEIARVYLAIPGMCKYGLLYTCLHRA